jgi:SAM-dependent methyltransferase
MAILIENTDAGEGTSATAAGIVDTSAVLSAQTREQFAADQVEMTRTWYNNLLKSGLNIDDYIAKRKAAYLDRWREAGRYIGAGGRILDIGGGNIYRELLDYFQAMRWDYWYADVGADEVGHAALLAASHGFDPSHFSRRLNHELIYEESFFDAVFSSHCIEHSMDLRLTLRQLNRILKLGGNLVVSIPFGWDAQPNHPYFLMENEWLTLIEDAGFRIRAYQISSEYPEAGYDLMVAAQKAGPIGDRFRVDVDAYVKSHFAFRDFRDPAVRCFGERVEKPGHIILDGAGWRIEVALEAGVTEVLPVFIHHSWSGIVSVWSGADSLCADLFRPQAATEPLRLKLSAPAQAGQIAHVSPIGKNDTSVSSQGVFVGVMTR